MKCKPFLKWAGGKAQLIPELIKHLPQDFFTTTKTYIEPFLGGGAMLFWLLNQKQHPSHIIVNDVNFKLVDTYKALRDTPDELMRKLSSLANKYQFELDEVKRALWYYKVRSMFNASKGSLDKIRRAAFFIFLNRTCYNGLYRENSKGEFNVPFGRYINPTICDKTLLKRDSAALADVLLENTDFATGTIGCDNIKEETFVYLDPPYRPLNNTSSFCQYTKKGFDDGDQRRLAACCRRLDAQGVRWMLSNSSTDDGFFQELYKGFNIHHVHATRRVNSDADKRGALTELLITNYQD